MPHKWQYYHDIGFVYYWRLRDYQTAATWFQRAAETAERAELAASRWPPRCSCDGNDRAAARFLWQQIAKSEEAWLRQSAERSLLQLQALDQIDQLEAVVNRFPPAAGERYSWNDLMRRTGPDTVAGRSRRRAVCHRSRHWTRAGVGDTRRCFRCRRSPGGSQ